MVEHWPGKALGSIPSSTDQPTNQPVNQPVYRASEAMNECSQAMQVNLGNSRVLFDIYIFA